MAPYGHWWATHLVYCLHFNNKFDYFASRSVLEGSFVVRIMHITQMFHGYFYLSQVLKIIIPLLLGAFLGQPH